MKIISLEAENVKRLVAVEITPEGNVVVIGGKNGAGKTSVLDAIAYACGGKDAICDEPLRQGAKKGHVVADLGDLIVKRTFTKGGGTQLVVTDPDGEKMASPQTLLDRLVGKLTFDPLGFSRMKPAEQRETLQALVGLDFSELTEQRDAIYSERAVVNRGVKTLQATLRMVPEDDDAPDEEVSVSALMEEFQAANASRKKAELAAHEAREQAERVIAGEAAQGQNAKEIENLEKQLARAIERKDEIKQLLKAERADATNLEKAAKAARVAVVDPRPIRERIDGAEEINRRVRVQAERARDAATLRDRMKASAELTRKIEGLDEKKEADLAAAEFPVEGLSFDEDAVLFNGVPFGQASSAEQLRVSVAMGLAMNPKLRVLLVRDGSLLDEESLRLVAEMAEEKDAQVWIERVGEGAEVSVVIEEGEVKE